MEKSHVELRVGLGKRLKELRESHKFTQTQLAKKLGVSQAAYSLMENSRNGIGLSHIVALSGLYGITTDYILKGDKSIEKISPENDFVPFIKEKAHAGFLENYNDEVAYEDYD
jgi:transcriptional regulator with XRE-family HTH domain